LFLSKDESIEFEFKSKDGDRYDVHYYIDLEDGAFEDWFGPFGSSTLQT